VDREVIFACVVYRGDNVGHAPRPHNTERPQLVNARITGVELRENVVAADIALQQTAKIFFDSLLICVH
jgi:hypothetical protein